MIPLSIEDVSRETHDRLREFSDLVLKWTPKINLVSRKDQGQIWSRHILDSLQVASFGQHATKWVDIGSGGGFPALVVACMFKEVSPETQFTLIESDQRKSTFLRTAARQLELNVTVLAERIEAARPQNASVLSARALADLSGLLHYADRHLNKDGIALFQKGAGWKKELTDAQESWRFRYETYKSQTNEAAVILKIQGASRD